MNQEVKEAFVEFLEEIVGHRDSKKDIVATMHTYLEDAETELVLVCESIDALASRAGALKQAISRMRNRLSDIRGEM